MILAHRRKTLVILARQILGRSEMSRLGRLWPTLRSPLYPRGTLTKSRHQMETPRPGAPVKRIFHVRLAVHITRTIPLDQSTGSSGTILTSDLYARLLPYRLIVKNRSRIRRCLECLPRLSVFIVPGSARTTSQRRPTLLVIESDLKGDLDDYKRKTR